MIRLARKENAKCHRATKIAGALANPAADFWQAINERLMAHGKYEEKPLINR